MATQLPDSEPRGGPPPAVLTAHLGYLLKHAQLRFAELSTAALAPFGVNGREAAVLRAIDGPQPLAQGEIARRMGIDRTTMVALVDELQARGLVQRRQDPGDRRRNVVELTPAGQDVLRRATRAGEQAERAFLSPLPPADAQRFKDILRALLGGPAPGAG